MNWLDGIWALAWVVIICGGGTLVFALGWHLFYRSRGGWSDKNRPYHAEYSEHVLWRGFQSLFVGVIAPGLVYAITGLTSYYYGDARFISDSTSAGMYVQVDPDYLLSKTHVGYKKDDLFFIQAKPGVRGIRRVLHVPDEKLREHLKPLSEFRLLEIEFVEKQPAAPWRWMGPKLTTSGYHIVGYGGKEEYVQGFGLWAFIKS